jgi:steroid delta-isomerase-like uncharacterized protein
MSQDNLKVVESVHDHYSKKELDEAAAVIADQFQWTVVAFGMTMNGREGFNQGFMSFATAFPDSQIHQKNAVVNGDQVVIEYDFVGTHSGPLATPTGPVPPTGKSVNLPGIEVYEVQNGKVTSLRTYFDAATMMRQLGLLS